jgi:hypothetical protein
MGTITDETRRALMDLVVNYAIGVDHRDYSLVESLFVANARLAMTPQGCPDSDTFEVDVRGRDEIMRIIARPDLFLRTMHFIGQQRVHGVRDAARGETYCLAHHLRRENQKASLYVMAIRYVDRFARFEGYWRFAERILRVDWVEERSVADAPLDWRTL